MASSRIIVADGTYDLSNVKNHNDLKEEIALLKTAIHNDEHMLVMHLKKAPQEVLKSTADAVLPSFINKMIANGSWKILTNGAGLLMNPFSKKLSFGKSIVGSAKKLGVLAMMKGAYSLWKNKGTDHATRKSQLKNKPVTTKIERSTIPIRPIK